MLNKIRHKLKMVLQLDCSPRKVAMSCAVGVFIGFSPFMGFHTAMALGASFIWDLPLYPLIIGAYITNPFTFIPVYTVCYKFGVLVTGQHAAAPPNFSDMTLTTLTHTAKTFMVPFFVGTHLLGLILAVIAYIVSYYLFKKYRGRA